MILSAAVPGALPAGVALGAPAWHAVIQAESFRIMAAVGPEVCGITNV